MNKFEWVLVRWMKLEPVLQSEVSHKEKNKYRILIHIYEILRVLWTARRSSQSILKEINPKYSLEVLMLKLKLQYFGHLIWRANSLEKIPMLERLRAGGEGGDRGWDGWMAPLTWRTWVSASLWCWWWTGRSGMLQSMGLQRIGHDRAIELNWFNRIFIKKQQWTSQVSNK